MVLSRPKEILGPTSSREDRMYVFVWLSPFARMQLSGKKHEKPMVFTYVYWPPCLLMETLSDCLCGGCRVADLVPPSRLGLEPTSLMGYQVIL